MLRKLLIIVCMLGTANAIAQKTAPSPKTTQKQDAPTIDYKQMGAPLPSLMFVPYADTTIKDTENGLSPKYLLDSATLRDQRKKRKHKQDSKTYGAASNGFITEKELTGDGNLFIMMFNPTCSHCQDETVMLEKNIGLFNKTKVVLLANFAMRPYMHDFVQMLHIDQYPSLHPYLDSAGAFIDKVFLYQQLPQINIYDSDRKLLKTYTGEVAFDSLKKYIN